MMTTADWTNIGTSTLPETDREKFLTAVAGMEWVEPTGTHPMAPALALKTVVAEFNIRPVTAISYDQAWEGRDDVEAFAYGILGVRTRKQRIVFLDTGVSVVPVVILPYDSEAVAA